MSDPIPLFEITWGREEVQNAVDSITRGGCWAKGPYVEQFEDSIESYLGVEHAVVFNSGTTALSTALQTHGIGPGDEVIVPSFTFIATANAVLLVGAEPVFADIERPTYSLDPDDVRDRITDDTAAIVPVHYGGAPCRLDDLEGIADDNELVLIDDAAEAFGTEFRGRKVGTYCDSTVFSFCQNKVATTGEGGAVVTDDDEVARELRLYQSHGRASTDYFESSGSGDYVALGSNFRMSDLVAALGVAQMDKIESIIERRRRRGAQYTDAFEDMGGVTPPAEPADGRHVFQLYTVRFDDPVDRDVVIEGLAERDIASKVYFDPVHQSTFYKQKFGYSEGLLPTTESVASNVLSLPIYPDLSADRAERVIEGVAAELARQ